MKITRLKDRDERQGWTFLCVHGRNAHYQCAVSRVRAFAQPKAAWWAERGNMDMAEMEALRWARAEARRMAWREFKRAGVA